MDKIITYDWLLAHAKDPEDGLTRAFASVIQVAANGSIQPSNLAMGLSRERFIELLDRYFPGASCEIYGDSCKTPCDQCVQLRDSEFEDLVQLLLDHRSNDYEPTEWLAYAIASGCMGGNHLYQDMGLPNRQALSSLLEDYFTTLFLKNVGNMKWKKFFYKQLCDRAEVKMCTAPSCQVCDDYLKCFGPEDDTGLAALSAAGSKGPQQEEEMPVLFPAWESGLPDKYSGDVAVPVRFEQFEAPSDQAQKIFGYDEQGQCCYYRHQHMLTRDVPDDEDNFYSEQACFESVQAWRLKGGDWLRYSTTGSAAGSGSDRWLEAEYEITLSRPK